MHASDYANMEWPQVNKKLGQAKKFDNFITKSIQ